MFALACFLCNVISFIINMDFVLIILTVHCAILLSKFWCLSFVIISTVNCESANMGGFDSRYHFVLQI